MAGSLSKEEGHGSEAELEAKKKAQLRRIYIAAYQSVAQHMIVLQSEPILVRELCNGDLGRTAMLLGNTTGLVGVLGVFLNQFGGKLSDAIGRKPGLLLGPLVNIILGLLVTNNSHNLALVLICRMIRLVSTTFSNTVMLGAALADTVQGKELGQKSSVIGAIVGLGITTTPIIETALMKFHGHPRHLYKYLALLGGVQATITAFSMEESLETAKRKPLESVMNFSAINPFGFIKLYTQGSSVLRQLCNIVSLQMMLEGKNLSDLMEFWKREHLGWSMEQSRNFIVVYGALNIFAGIAITPKMLAALTAKGFTTVCNLLNSLAFFLRGVKENTWVFLSAVPPMLPGVNGAAATALKAYATDLATREGFGKGEFSAWLNNLRALISAFATVIYGNYYNWCKTRGVFPGSTFWVGGLVGAVIPELLLQSMKSEDFDIEAVMKKQTAS